MRILSHKGLDDIIDELVSLGREQIRRWQQMALLLMTVQDDELWRDGGFSSFTAFVGHLATESGAQESTFWRALRAGRVYLEAQRTRPKLAPLGEAPRTSALSLEILDKITRHAPEDLAVELTDKTLRGEVTNDQLREIWKDFKRSRRVKTLDGGNGSGDLSSATPSTATIITAIRRLGPTWVPNAHEASRCHLFTEVALLPDQEEISPILNLVAAVEVWDRRIPELHGIRVALEENECDLEQLEEEHATFVDQLWVAVPNDLAAVFRRKCAFLGVLAVGGTVVRVAREPKRPPDLKDRTGELAKALLIQSLKWSRAKSVRARQMLW